MRGRPRANPAAPVLSVASESAFQDRVIGLAHALGFRVAHFRSVRIARPDGSFRYATPVQADGAGYPDLHIVGSGRSIFAELKRQRGSKTTSEQLDWLASLRACGHEAYLWKPADWDEIVAVLGRGRAR